LVLYEGGEDACRGGVEEGEISFGEVLEGGGEVAL
jgi:hypothetical protein